ISWLVPRPASLNDTTRFVPLRAALALTKCGLTASAGTAYASTIASDAASSITFLNIKGFLLHLVGLYCSLRTGACLRHCLRVVECLFAGAGRTCVALSIDHTSVRPLAVL